MSNNNTNIIKGFAKTAGEGERIWFVAYALTLKATAATTGKSYTVIECLTAPGGGPPPHIHTNEDEFWYVLDGIFEIHIGDEVHAIGPGGFEDFFRESGQPAINDGPAPPVDEAEIARMKAAAPKYSIERATVED